ncbi:MAG: fused MFS/spermidine synthase, partial [Myxococcota bacterium]
CALLLLANGLLGLLLSRRAGAAIAAASSTLVLGFTAILLAPTPAIKPAGDSVLYETESAYNYIQVRGEGHQRGLYLNDGFAVQTYHSTLGNLSLQGTWRYYTQAPAWTTIGAPRRVLLLGLGGGGAALNYRTLYPEVEVTGVEIDPVVVEVGRTYMGLPKETRVLSQDARTFLARDNQTYDVIITDAFDFPYIPFQLTTQEFFAQVESRLAQGGVLVLNVGRYGPNYEVVDAIVQTLKTQFPRVDGVDVGNSNTVLVAARHSADRDVGLGGLGLDRHTQRRLRGRPLRPWTPSPDAPVLTDDRAPVEWLTDQVIFKTLLKM